MTERKPCRICGENKPLEDFHRRTQAPDGHATACKPCAIAEQQRTRRLPTLWVTHGGLAKDCAQCKERKLIDEFPKHRSMPGGYNHICKACLYLRRREWGTTEAGRNKTKATDRKRYHADPVRARNNRIDYNHGLPLGTYAKLLEMQDGCCAICGRHQSPGKRRVSIDHCHSTNVIRGLLCMFCNQAIGQFEDSPELLRKAIAYLENPPAMHLALTSRFERKAKRSSA